MSSKETKAKRRAMPGITLEESIRRGDLPPFYHLQDTIDLKEAAIQRGKERRQEWLEGKLWGWPRNPTNTPNNRPIQA